MYFETSAKDGSNVTDLFQWVANALYTMQCTGGFKGTKDKTIKIKKHKRRKKKEKKGCCK